MTLGDPTSLIPEDPTLENYIQVLGVDNFARYFLNSARRRDRQHRAHRRAVVDDGLRVLAPAVPGRRILFALIVVGLTIPTMMLIIPQFLLARDLGLLNSLQGLVPFYVGTALGFNTFLLSGFFQGIPRELDEAMIIDGAGPWRRYWSLALPSRGLRWRPA